MCIAVKSPPRNDYDHDSTRKSAPVGSSFPRRRLYPQEMDWDQSGRVTFKEFLFAVEGWGGLEEEEEE